MPTTEYVRPGSFADFTRRLQEVGLNERQYCVLTGYHRSRLSRIRRGDSQLRRGDWLIMRFLEEHPEVVKEFLAWYEDGGPLDLTAAIRDSAEAARK